MQPNLLAKPGKTTNPPMHTELVLNKSVQNLYENIYSQLNKYCETYLKLHDMNSLTEVIIIWSGHYSHKKEIYV